MASGALPGFRDFYPPEFSERAFVMQTWREVARRYAFVEYDGPPLEPLDLYTRKSGDEIVAQLYNFTDKGGRDVSLRPEMTPTLARMVAARANALRKPVRWFSMPQLFRYERQQKGRLREHFQLNLDILGEPDVTADAELLAVAIDIVRAFGLTRDDVVARVSDRRLWHDRFVGNGVSAGQLPQLFAVIDKIERSPREVTLERLAAIGLEPRVIDDVVAFVQRKSVDEFIDAFEGAAGMQERVRELRRYRAYLQALEVLDFVVVDTTIVRGLAYYTGIVFELFDARGEFRAICGGGRYDNLLESLGGVPMPALGFGMGDVVLTELLRARGRLPAGGASLDYWVAGSDDALLPQVMTIATRLRAGGRSVEYALRGQALGRQLKSAAAAGAQRVVIVRPDLVEQGEAVIKTLADGREERVRLNDWLDAA
jgi:histidyl-tRNA synthetase